MSAAECALTRLMIVASVVWYAMLLVFAQMPGPRYGGSVPHPRPASCRASAMVSLQIMLLREAGEQFRGRVMGVRMMAIYSLPLGLLAAGPLIDWIGFRATASLYAIDRARLHARSSRCAGARICGGA